MARPYFIRYRRPSLGTMLGITRGVPHKFLQKPLSDGNKTTSEEIQ